MIEIIVTKLQKLKAQDIAFSIFGANTHKYNFNPILTEDEIFAFEQAYKINLPNEYRQFLMQVGNGGAGPFYGLYCIDNEENSKTDLPNDFLYARDNPLKIMELIDRKSGV